MKMDAAEFAGYHRQTLEVDKVRHNVLLAVLEHFAKQKPADFLLWTRGGPGECAVKTSGRPILLGDLSEASVGPDSNCRIISGQSRQYVQSLG
jgi:hypothetical protein